MSPRESSKKQRTKSRREKKDPALYRRCSLLTTQVIKAVISWLSQSKISRTKKRIMGKKAKVRQTSTSSGKETRKSLIPKWNTFLISILSRCSKFLSSTSLSGTQTISSALPRRSLSRVLISKMWHSSTRFRSMKTKFLKATTSEGMYLRMRTTRSTTLKSPWILCTPTRSIDLITSRLILRRAQLSFLTSRSFCSRATKSLLSEMPSCL